MIIELEQASAQTSGAAFYLTQPPYLHEGLSLALIGNKGSGKSNALAVITEESHRNHLPFIMYDPNGDADSLRELGQDVIVIGDTRESGLRQAHFSLTQAMSNPGYYLNLALVEGFSLVIDLAGLTEDEQCEAFTRIAGKHYDLARDLREPCMVAVDEAHIFAPQSMAGAMQKASLHKFTRIMSDGRKRGILLAVATQRATFISKNVLALANVRMFGKITYHPDFDRIKPYLPPRVKFAQLNGLTVGQYYLISQTRWGLIQVKLRRTTDLGGTPVISRRDKRERPNIEDLQLALPLEVKVSR